MAGLMARGPLIKKQPGLEVRLEYRAGGREGAGRGERVRE